MHPAQIPTLVVQRSTSILLETDESNNHQMFVHYVTFNLRRRQLWSHRMSDIELRWLYSPHH